MEARIKKSLPEPVRKGREGMSPAHLAMVRKLWCIGCGRSAQEAHHLLRSVPEGERGMGRKASDRYALPLCTTCHRDAHNHGDDEVWLIGRGVDARSITDALWSNRGDETAMRRVVERSLISRRIYVG